MPGDAWQRLATLRAYFAFMWSHPGGKLLFMGGEFAQPSEWNHDTSLDWDLLDQPSHRGVQRLLRDLNLLYRATPSLHVQDREPAGFRWVIGDDRSQSVFAFFRLGGPEPVLVVCNFTPIPQHAYRIGVPVGGLWRECLNTDAALYGGSNVGNLGAVAAAFVPSHGHPASLSLSLPPLATLILRQDAAA